MLSQAIESVTRVFYARADLDLIMSSPVKLTNIFSVRIAAIALSVTGMALLFSSPFVDVLIIGGGIRWFSAFGVVIAIGLSAAAVAIAITVLLFHLIGPSRTRLVAQILAAIIGAGFVIALQIAAILSYGTLSRFAVLTSDAAAAYAPDPDSPVWWPAHAAIGNGEALALLLAASLVLLGGVMAIFSPKFAGTVVKRLGGGNDDPPRAAHNRVSPRLAASGAALEGIHAAAARSLAGVAEPDAAALSGAAGADAVAQLFRQFGRDHPDRARDRDGGRPARRRSRLADDFGRGRRRPGRDRADAAARVTRAKIEVVLITIAVIFAPLVAALAFASPVQAAVTAMFVIIATVSAAAIQLWFRVQAKRSQFRRRQTSSRRGDVCGSLLLDRLGRHGRARHIGPDRRADQRRDDGGHSRRHLEDQPAARLIRPRTSAQTSRLVSRVTQLQGYGRIARTSRGIGIDCLRSLGRGGRYGDREASPQAAHRSVCGRNNAVPGSLSGPCRDAL